MFSLALASNKRATLGNYLKLSDRVWKIWWNSISSWPYVPLFCKPHAWIIGKYWNSLVLGQSFNNLHAHNNDNLFLGVIMNASMVLLMSFFTQKANYAIPTWKPTSALMLWLNIHFSGSAVTFPRSWYVIFYDISLRWCTYKL